MTTEFTVVRPTLATKFAALWATTVARTQIVRRYPGLLALDVVAPVIMASMPILLGPAVAGAGRAAANFQANTGTANYVAYLMIGGNIFSLVNLAFNHVSYWLRHEQETGTLEALYLAPVNRLWVIGGVAAYSAARAMLTSAAAFALACLVYGVDPRQGHLALTFLFLLSGSLPVYGLSLFFGALVLQLKEVGALMELAKWVVGFLMGMYYPVTVFPPLLRWAAYAFPPTWLLNGVRASLLGLGYFFGAWYADLAVIWGFCLLAPLVGGWAFGRVEERIRKNQGMGEF